MRGADDRDRGHPCNSSVFKSGSCGLVLIQVQGYLQLLRRKKNLLYIFVTNWETLWLSKLFAQLSLQRSFHFVLKSLLFLLLREGVDKCRKIIHWSQPRDCLTLGPDSGTSSAPLTGEIFYFITITQKYSKFVANIMNHFLMAVR